MERDKSTVEQSLMREIDQLKGIIGELTIANETLKNSSCEERWEAMNDLVSKGFSESRSAFLTGIARSMIYYEHRKRNPQYDMELENRISNIVSERPSYGTRRVGSMIRRAGIIVGETL